MSNLELSIRYNIFMEETIQIFFDIMMRKIPILIERSITDQIHSYRCSESLKRKFQKKKRTIVSWLQNKVMHDNSWFSGAITSMQPVTTVISYEY